jgi:hypothetical protein
MVGQGIASRCSGDGRPNDTVAACDWESILATLARAHSVPSCEPQARHNRSSRVSQPAGACCGSARRAERNGLEHRWPGDEKAVIKAAFGARVCAQKWRGRVPRGGRRREWSLPLPVQAGASRRRTPKTAVPPPPGHARPAQRHLASAHPNMTTIKAVLRANPARGGEHRPEPVAVLFVQRVALTRVPCQHAQGEGAWRPRSQRWPA